MENSSNLSQDNGSSVHESLILGQVEGSWDRVSAGSREEMEGVNRGIDEGNGNLEGQNGGAGREIAISNDESVAELEVDQVEHNANTVSMEGENENELTSEAEMHSSISSVVSLRPKMGNTGEHATRDGCTVSEAFEHVRNEKGINLVVDLTGPHGLEKVDIRNDNGINLVVDLNGGYGANAGRSRGNSINYDETEVTEDLRGIKLVVDLTAWHHANMEHLSGSGVGNKRTELSERKNANLMGYINAQCDAGEEYLLGNGIDNKGTEIKEGLHARSPPLFDGGVFNVASCDKGVGLQESQDIMVEDQIAHVRSKCRDGDDFKVFALNPKIGTEDCRTEKEGEFCLSDLVWGKVRGHPWWPGQIFEPSAASAKAIKHFKRESYLVGYFGDQTFAWNEAARIKPFRMHFAQMEKQSNMESFCHAMECALEEVSRRVEYGLSCSCIPERLLAKIEYQTIVSAGIQGESRRRNGGDNISSASTFEPAELLERLEALAAAPYSGIGRLSFVIARAQLVSFNRWKGFNQLPEVVELDGLLEKDDVHVLTKEDLAEVMDDNVLDSRSNGEALTSKVQSAIQESSSCTSKHGSRSYECPSKKEKRETGSPFAAADDEKKLESIQWRKKGSSSSAFVSVDSKLNLSPRVEKEFPSRPKKYIKKGERVCRDANQLGESVPTIECGQRSSRSLKRVDEKNLVDADFGVVAPISAKLQYNKSFPVNMPAPVELLSKLCLAASDPVGEYRSIQSCISLFSFFRNSICLQNINTGKRRRTTEEHGGKTSSIPETVETFEFEGIKDSYWTDRIIQSNAEGQVLFEPENLLEKTTPAPEPLSVSAACPSLDSKQDSGGGADGAKAENTIAFVGENSEDYNPTVFILRFSDFESVPSIMDLNNIFSRYGPLEESRTRVASKHGQVVFKRRSDAETAFSSAGKYSIFGPSLLSYRLKPLPKASIVSKRNRKRAKTA